MKVFSILLTAMLVRYFVLAGALDFLCSHTRRKSLAKMSRIEGQNFSDIKWSVLSTIVFAFFGTILVEMWRNDQTKIYLDAGEYGVFYLIASFPLFLFLQDTYFYWTHRLLHRKAFFRFHKSHHHSFAPTAWTSFAFHPIEAFIQALALPVLVILLPVHWAVFLLLLIFMTVFGLLNHLGHEFCPPYFEKKLGLITATHHQFHHEHLTKNFGLYFTWWDHLFGTERSQK